MVGIGSAAGVKTPSKHRDPFATETILVVLVQSRKGIAGLTDAFMSISSPSFW
jgi:hypothetical protein